MTFHTPKTRHRASRGEFAREAVLAEFRPRDGRALFHDGFEDRRPCDKPKRLDHVAAEAVGNIGQAALTHWLQVATRTSGPEHEVAIKIAREIAAMLGVPWAEVMSEEAA